MSAYRRGEKCYIHVPLRTGGTKIIAAGTADKPTAKAMQRMGRALADRGDWALLEAVTRPQPVRQRREALRELFDAYRANALDALRARADDVDLEPHVEHWKATVEARMKPKGAAIRVSYVRTLIPEGTPYPRSRLTPEAVAAWQASPPQRPTVARTGQGMRKLRRQALSSFCAYLIDVGVLRENPVRKVKGVGAPRKRVRWLAPEDMARLIDAFPEPYRTLSALLHGAGLEISVALALRARDIDAKARAVRAAGTKTEDRDRVAKIRAFAWPYVERHLRTLTPSAKLFEGISYFLARKAHKAACAAAHIDDYTLHDARHSFAVQLRREGVPDALIAANLGHKDETEVVATYGRYRVELDDWARWEAIIAFRAADDREEAK